MFTKNSEPSTEYSLDENLALLAMNLGKLPEILTDRRPGGLQSIGLQRVGHN